MQDFDFFKKDREGSSGAWKYPPPQSSNDWQTLRDAVRRHPRVIQVAVFCLATLGFMAMFSPI